MAEKDPNKLYNGIKSLQDDLESIRTLVDGIIENSKILMNDANNFGGVIAKVFKEQMAKYFIPGVQGIAEPIDNLVSGDRVPGSLKDLTIFLDSVPLAMIRQEPSVTELASPVVPKNVNLDTPAGKVESPVDEIPQNQSYQTEAAPIEESKKKALNFRRFKEFIDWNNPEDQERWRNSPKGKLEGDWFKNKVHGLKKGYNPFEDDAVVNKPWNGLYNEMDAKDHLERFGRVYVDEEHNSVLDPYYTKSLLATWGEPNRLDDDNVAMTESKEEDDGKPGIYQVRRISGIGSSLGEEISNIEPQVVCEFDTKEEAEERKAELEASVLPEEKELLGTSYEIHKVPLKVEE